MSWGRGGLVLTHVLLLALHCSAFLPNFWSRVLTLSWDSRTHQFLTEEAILNVTLETLRGARPGGAEEQVNAEHKGRNTAPPSQTRLGRSFWRAVGEVVRSNAAMDFLSSTRSDPVYHFDSERVEGSTLMLRQFWAQTLISVQADEFQSARRSLGQLFHSLQDFYSHSNWVEMGQRSVYLHLLQPAEPAVPVATGDTPTCMECFSATCRNNLTPRLTTTLLLTSGYFSSFPPKPQGKCSHGGVLDSSRSVEARGGINKDSTSPLFSPHHYLHQDAAALAADATVGVLRDLRDAVGHRTFLRLFSVQQIPALVFVMDTTGSMFEEITAARLRAHAIIQTRARVPGQHGTFVLVPFHDPEVGPVYETDDPDEFMRHMENLTALGGGDEPEMCLSAVQLALTHSPPLSEIFVFTDASPKDAHLGDVVKALALDKQTKVTFLLTEDPTYPAVRRGRRRRRRTSLSTDRFSLYSSLSSSSGGLTIFTSNSDIHGASRIVEDNTASERVALLHVDSDHELMSSRSFRVDSSVNNVTLHITGFLTECFLTDPSGETQSLNEPGSLARSEHFKGLYRVRLLPPVQPGRWELTARSNGHVTFSVMADSSVDFLYYFATETNETHPGLTRVEGSPVAGASVFLVLAVTGLGPQQNPSFSHATLLDAEGTSLQQVALTSSSPSTSAYSALELVGRVESVPRVSFCIRLTGRDDAGNKLERVSMETIQPTHIEIQLLSVPHLVPGHSTTLSFDIVNHGPGRILSLTTNDDRGYGDTSGPLRFYVADGGVFRSQAALHTPPGAQAGASVALTVTVGALDSADSNSAVVYLTVVPPDADTSPPSCFASRVQTSCRPACGGSSWSVELAVSDRGRSGLAALQLQEGDGVLTLFLDPSPPGDGSRWSQADRHHRAQLERGATPLNVSAWAPGSWRPLWASYTSSCCSPRAELLVWDGAGNMRRCRLAAGVKTPPRNGSATRTPTTGWVLTLCLLAVAQL